MLPGATRSSGLLVGLIPPTVHVRISLSQKFSLKGASFVISGAFVAIWLHCHNVMLSSERGCVAAFILSNFTLLG